MDTERAFISKVALTGQIDSILADGINETHFENDGLQDIFSFMASHTRQYKGPPSMEVMRETFPNFNFEVSTDSLEYLKDRFRRHAKRRFAMKSLMDLAEIVNKSDEDNIESLFLEESRRLAQLMPSSQVHRFSDIDKRIDQYETGEQNKVGIKMGIPEFDRLTFGIQPHEFVSVVGWQGTGKSTLCGWFAFNAFKQEKTVLVISLEMEAAALMRKWDTMLTNFEYRALKSHELSDQDVEKWRALAKSVREGKSDIIVKDDVRSCTPDYVYGEVIRYQPDMVIVDYISLMETSRSAGTQHWEKVTYLTQSLKQIARTTGVPIIGVAQTNINSASGGAQLDNIAYSRSIGQDSDIVLGLHQDEEMKENQQMTVRMLKYRDGQTAETDLLWEMDRMRFCPWNEVEFFKNQEKRRKLIETEQGQVDTETGEIVE